MAEQKMTYQEKLDKMADQIAIGEGVKKERYLEGQWNAIHERFKGYARTAVAAQAEAIREALRRWGVREEDIHNELLEHGYIEPKTEDDGK